MKEIRFSHLAGFGALKAWFAGHLEWFRENGPPAPRAIVLAGLPGTGKRSVAKAIATELGRPLVSFPTERGTDPGNVLLVEDLDRGHLPLIRRLADPDEPMPFVVATTERPWELPSGLFRSDAIDAIWHLDLPDTRERALIWDLAAKRHGVPNPRFDHVILARASHELTPGEIHAAFGRAMRASHPKTPGEKHLLAAIVDVHHFGGVRQGDLARMTAWAARSANNARST